MRDILKKQPHWKRKPLKKDKRRWIYVVDRARPGSSDYTAHVFARVGYNGEVVFSGMQVYRNDSFPAYATPTVT